MYSVSGILDSSAQAKCLNPQRDKIQALSMKDLPLCTVPNQHHNLQSILCQTVNCNIQNRIYRLNLVVLILPS